MNAELRLDRAEKYFFFRLLHGISLSMHQPPLPSYHFIVQVGRGNVTDYDVNVVSIFISEYFI